MYRGVALNSPCSGDDRNLWKIIVWGRPKRQSKRPRNGLRTPQAPRTTLAIGHRAPRGQQVVREERGSVWGLGQRLEAAVGYQVAGGRGVQGVQSVVWFGGYPTVHKRQRRRVQSCVAKTIQTACAHVVKPKSCGIGAQHEACNQDCQILGLAGFCV